jgi:hypothetical protein
MSGDDPGLVPHMWYSAYERRKAEADHERRQILQWLSTCYQYMLVNELTSLYKINMIPALIVRKVLLEF